LWLFGLISVSFEIVNNYIYTNTGFDGE
jgi:hypothetical protein